jgi:predicted kinase
MIIALHGTNGAGKSTLARTIMSEYETKEPLMATGRRKPLGYNLTMEGIPDLFVPGHYEIANGGIDTIKSLDDVYYLIQLANTQGKNVLFEGKNMSNGSGRILRHCLRTNTRIILIDHPVDECIASVRARGHTIKEETIRKLHRKARLDAEVLTQHGYQVAVCDRESALETCRLWLREIASQDLYVV